MRLGYLAPYTPGEFAVARKMGFDGIELRVNWDADAGEVDIAGRLGEVVDDLQQNDIKVTALACYNVPPVDDAPGLRKAFTRLAKVARGVGTSVIAALPLRVPDLSIEEHMPLFKKSYGGVAKIAENAGVKVAFEPWPGKVVGYGPYRWTSLAVTPTVWEMMFDAVPSKAIGLEYDPSHLYWQQVDYVKAIHDFGRRIHHVHAKDTLIDRKRLAKGGSHAPGWWRFTIPGLGEIDWKGVFAALAKVRYKGDMAIEHEDAKFLGSRRNLGLKKGFAFLRPLMPKA